MDDVDKTQPRLERCITFLVLLHEITTSLVVQNNTTYYLTVLAVRSLKWVSLGLTRDVGRAVFLLEAPGRIQFPEAACMPWLVAKASNGPLSLSHHNSDTDSFTCFFHI